MASAEDNAIELARLSQRVEDHIRNPSGHEGIGDLYDRITTMEKNLLQIKYTGYGVAAMLVLLASGFDLAALGQLLGLSG